MYVRHFFQMHLVDIITRLNNDRLVVMCFCFDPDVE